MSVSIGSVIPRAMRPVPASQGLLLSGRRGYKAADIWITGKWTGMDAAARRVQRPK